MERLTPPLPAPGAVTSFPIHADGGLIYHPISREKQAFLQAYDGVETRGITLSLPRMEQQAALFADVEIPKKITAYDAIPLSYTLRAKQAIDQPIHLVATAFESSAREGEALYYDLSLPGRVDLDWEYLGYVAGTDDYTARACLGRDPKEDRTGRCYPQYHASSLRCSGSVQRASLLWFKLRYTNTGNTILDGDGTGTFCVEAVLFRKDEGGAWVKKAPMENLFNRFIDEVYPGESGEMFFIFDNCFDLPEGEYKIVINGLVRNETDHPERYEKNIWAGETYTSSEFVFSICEQQKEDAPPPAVVKTHLHPTPHRNRWLHRYEEFMTSFDSQLAGMAAGTELHDVMYLQCAPWTERIVVKMMIGEQEMAAIAVPVEVESDSVTVDVCPSCQTYVTGADRSVFPAVSAQSMADMRGNLQLGPDAAFHVIDNLLAMKECGVNLINTTQAFEFDASFGTRRANNIDACWFSLDVARALDLRLEGWIAYPYATAGTLQQANLLFGTDYKCASYGHPELAAANAKNALWQYLRWGDNYWQGAQDVVVLDAEDTRGWMRIDFNARKQMDAYEKQEFQKYLAERYGTVDQMNADWGSSYACFEEVDPEAGTLDDHSWRKYATASAAFCEWSRALAVLDEFRTELRARDYRQLLELVKEDLPTAKFNLRTEGANWIVSVDAATDNPHYRHVYYSQRRCAIVPEVLQRAQVLYSSSDYTTLPYTPREVAELTARSVQQGVIPMLLPQFDRMRDIAVNTRYGNDFTYEYHLAGEATKGAYINTVCSVFEWFRATYENGGVPGILWQDYLCDGYATATQRKEIAFFVEKLKRAMETPAGKAWQAECVAHKALPAKGAWSFPEAFVRKEIERVSALRGEGMRTAY